MADRADIPWDRITAFLDQTLPPSTTDSPWPAVCVTYAQSLDGKIAGKGGRPLALSCTESYALTHQLRATHSAILVGVQTVINDDPQLTARQCAPQTPLRNPQPVILDSTLRTPVACRLLTAPLSNPDARTPWILAGPQYDPVQKLRLETAGARVFVIDSPVEDAGGRVPLAEALRCLKREGISELMVEGGARVIGAFLALFNEVHHRPPTFNVPPLRCIITLALRWVGPDGIAVQVAHTNDAENNEPGLTSTTPQITDTLPGIAANCVLQLGRDIIMAGPIQG